MPIVFKFYFICILIKLIEFTESTDTIEMESYDNFNCFLENCQRKPYGRKIEEGDGGFLIRMHGNSDRYTPSKEYTVILENENENITFSTFYLVVRTTDSYEFDSGNIKIMNKTFSTFFPECPITYTSTEPKNQIQFSWVAPGTNHKCLIFEATILDLNGHWYEDQNRLTLKMSPEATDCELSEWGKWSKCSRTCGNGWQTRVRYVTKFDTFGGKPCVDYLHEVEKCEMPSCDLENVPNECQWTEWSEWSQCPITCGNGWQIRTKWMNCTTEQNGGEPCPFEFEDKNCKMPPCNLAYRYDPYECHLAEWSEWSQCSTTCGNGWQTRRKLFEKIEENIGRLCTHEDETKICEMPPCQWSEWSQCSTTCGYGWHTRRKLIEKIETNGGKRCPPEDDAKGCQMPPCDINSCDVNEWSFWSSCNTTCGIGIVHRRRNYLHNSASHRNCNVSLLQTEMCYGFCDGKAFPPHLCAVTEWSNWTKCSCGRKYRARKRNYVNEILLENERCFVLLEDRENCPITPACNSSEECGVTDWTEWTPCSKIPIEIPRYRSTRARIRRINYPTYNVKCNIEFFQKENCTTNITKSGVYEIDEENENDCQLSKWSHWSQCSTTCGTGRQMRYRHIEKDRKNEGKPCEGFLLETKMCEMPTCDLENVPSECNLIEWSEWSQCSKTCGDELYDNAWQARRRLTEEFEKNGGISCPPQSDIKKCELRSCYLENIPNDSHLTEWTEWSQCSRTCGNGWQTRRRLIWEIEKIDGKPPKLRQKKKCEMPPCQPCDVTAWSSWSRCSSDCGIGVQNRTRNYSNKFAFRRDCNVSLIDDKICHSDLCNSSLASFPFLCNVSEWSDWTECSCSSKYSFRRREYEDPLPNVTCHRSLEERKKCPIPSPCIYPKECGVLNWSAWSKCTEECGKSTKVRIRMIINPVIYASCNIELYEKVNCIADDIKCGENNSRSDLENTPRGYKLTEWTEWSECSTTCGTGRQVRRRLIEKIRKNLGKPWPPKLFKWKKCNMPLCLCFEPKIEEHGCNESFPRWHYDSSSKSCNIYNSCRENGNKTKYENLSECNILCKTPIKYSVTSCPYNDWSEWTPCSVTCGTGIQYRGREPKDDYNSLEYYAHLNCSFQVQQKYCFKPYCIHH